MDLDPVTRDLSAPTYETMATTSASVDGSRDEEEKPYMEPDPVSRDPSARTYETMATTSASVNGERSYENRTVVKQYRDIHQKAFLDHEYDDTL